MDAKCHRCLTPVTQGTNGMVYDVPPWMPEGSDPLATCYACDNDQELDAEDRRQEELIDAAVRSGRPV